MTFRGYQESNHVEVFLSFTIFAFFTILSFYLPFLHSVQFSVRLFIIIICLSLQSLLSFYPHSLYVFVLFFFLSFLQCVSS